MPFRRKEWSQWWFRSRENRTIDLHMSGRDRRLGARQLGRLVLLVTFVSFAFLVARNVWLVYHRTNDLDLLIRQAAKEMAEHRANPTGTNPAEKWWKRFWELGRHHQNPEIRKSATLNAISMLTNLREYSTAAELVEGLGPSFPGISGVLPLIRRAYDSREGIERFVEFGTRVIEKHPDENERKQVLLHLARSFVIDGDYERADLLLRNYSHLPYIRESVEVQSLEFEIRNLREGMKMPLFSCSTLSGDKVSMLDFLGRYSIVLFWSPNCGPSKQLAEAFLLAPIPQFSVLHVALAGDTNSVDRFLSELNNGVPSQAAVCVEGMNYSGPVSRQFNIFATPTAFFVDEEGVIIEKSRGNSAIHASIQRILESRFR